MTSDLEVTGDNLNLQKRQISENLNVVLVPFERVPVTLDGLVVLLVAPLQQTIHVPADVGPEVVTEAATDVIVRLVLTTQTVESQALDRMDKLEHTELPLVKHILIELNFLTSYIVYSTVL